VADLARLGAAVAVGPALALAFGLVVLVAKVGLDKVVAELRGYAVVRVDGLRVRVGADELV